MKTSMLSAMSACCVGYVHHTRIVLISLLFLFFGMNDFARASQGAKMQLSLRKALLVAISKEYNIQDAQAAVLQARSERLAAVGGFLPELSLTDQPQLYRPIGKSGNTVIAGTLVPANNGFFDNSITANFKLNLYSAGKYMAYFHSAEDAVSSADEKKINAISSTFAHILVTYEQLVQSKLKVDAEKQIVESMRHVAHLTQMRYQHGISSRLKWLEAEQQTLAAENKLEREQQKVASGSRGLLRAMGFDLGVASHFIVNSYIPPLVFNEGTFSKRTLLDSPSVKAAAMNIRMAQEKVKVAEAGFWPSLSLVAQYNWLGINANRPSMAMVNTMGNNYTVGLSLHIPLLPALSVVAAVQSAQAGIVNAMGDYNRALAITAGRQTEARQACWNAARSVKIAAQASVLANESLALTKEKLKGGQGNAIMVDQARVTAVRAENALKNARLKVRLANWLALRAYNPRRFASKLLVSSGDYGGQ